MRASFAISLILSLAAASPATPAPTIVHYPPSSAREGEPLVLTAALTETTARGGEVYYRAPGGKYSAVPLAREGDHWTAHVPGDDLRPPAVEYFIRMETRAGREVTFPREAADRNPAVLRVEPQAGRFELVSPARGEALDPDHVEIVGLFDPPLPGTEGLLVLLDGNDLTALTDASEEALILTAAPPLGPGPHELRVFYLDEGGGTKESRWPLTVGAPGRPSRPAVILHGRAETGWAAVSASYPDSGAPVLPYPERSGLALNLIAQGSAGAEEISCSVDRDPIYEGRTRWQLRLDGASHTIEAGDVLPYLAEETVAWFAARGLFVEGRKGGATTRLAALRTAEADVSLGSYSQYLVGAGTEFRHGRLGTGVSAAYAYDDENSLRDPAAPPPIFEAARNWVGAWETRAQLGTVGVRGAIAWSSLESGTRRRARAYRVGIEHAGARRHLALEFRSRRPGYFALGSPQINPGEEGLFLDARLEGGRRWRSSLRLELYRDYEVLEALERGRPVVGLWWNAERDSVRLLGGLSTFAIVHLSRVPYLDLPFRNDYVSLGLGDRRGSVTGRVSLRYQRSERGGTIDLWGLDGYLWYQPVTSGWDLRARATLDRSYDDLDQSDYRRPGCRLEARYRWPRLEARAALEWFRLEDYRVTARNYTETLFSASLGRSF